MIGMLISLTMQMLILMIRLSIALLVFSFYAIAWMVMAVSAAASKKSVPAFPAEAGRAWRSLS